MSDCGAKHQCANGRTGECSQEQGHLTRHICSECFALFTNETAVDVKARPLQTASGTHPSVQSFLQMQDAMRSPKADGEAQLFGIWETTIATPYGKLAVELILKPDKHFSQLSTMNGLMAYDVGTIQVEKEKFIHFTVTDHEPKKYNGVDIHWLKSWGYYYNVVDKDTMEFEDQIAKQRWTVKRA